MSNQRDTIAMEQYPCKSSTEIIDSENFYFQLNQNRRMLIQVSLNRLN